jgi:hypothetical protein
VYPSIHGLAIVSWSLSGLFKKLISLSGEKWRGDNEWKIEFSDMISIFFFFFEIDAPILIVGTKVA